MNNDELKKLAIKSNGETWNYLQKESLADDEKVQMLCCAYSSLYLWASSGGTSLNLARGHWLLSRVCCVLKEASLANKHAELCSVYTEMAADRKDFDEVYAIEAKARSMALSGDRVLAAQLKRQASELATKIQDPENKSIAEADILSEPWFGVN